MAKPAHSPQVHYKRRRRPSLHSHSSSQFNHGKSHQYSQPSFPQVQRNSEFPQVPAHPLQHTQDMDNKTRRPRPVIFPPSAATSTAGSSDAADMYMNQRWPNGIDRETLAQANPFVFPPKKKASITKEALEEIHDIVKDALTDSASNILAGIKADMINHVRDDIEQTSERIVIETYANIGMAINQIDQKMRANLKEMENTLSTRLRDVEGETRYEVGKAREMIKDEWDDLREGIEDLRKQMADVEDRLDKIPGKIVDELADKGWVVTDPGSLVFEC